MEYPCEQGDGALRANTGPAARRNSLRAAPASPRSDDVHEHEVPDHGQERGWSEMPMTNKETLRTSLDHRRLSMVRHVQQSTTLGLMRNTLFESRKSFRHESKYLGHLDSSDNPVSQMLKHVRVDPDGGALNLDGETNQLSKVHLLPKGCVTRGLTVLSLVRSLGNPVFILITNSSWLLQWYHQDEVFAVAFQEIFGDRDGTWLERGFILVIACELIMTMFVVLRALYHLMEIMISMCCTSPEPEHVSRGSREFQPLHTKASDPIGRFHLLVSNFFFEDLPVIQSVSIMRLLAFVHPDVVCRNYQMVEVSGDASRAILERFFRVKHNDATELEMAELLERFCYQLSELCPGEYEQREPHFEANYNQQMYLLRTVVNSTPSQVLDTFASEIDLSVRSDFWKFRTVQCAEVLLFAISVVCVAGLAFVGFYCKVCRVAIQIHTGEDWERLLYTAAFMNQCMSIFNIKQLLFWRVRVFLFGGLDCEVSSLDQLVMRMYMGMLSHAVWNIPEFSALDKLCVMVEFDDNVLQRLVMEEDLQEKGKSILKLKRMYEDTHTDVLARFFQRGPNCPAPRETVILGRIDR